MLTVCPKCTLTLAVSAGDLRVGQGYVRCGRCTTVFNALLSLSEETPGQAAAPAELPPEPEESPGSSTVENIVLEGDGVLQTEEFVDIGTINQEIADATRLHALAAAAQAEQSEEQSTPEFWLRDEADADEEPAAPAAPVDEPELPEALELELSQQPLAAGRHKALWAVAASLLVALAGLQLIHQWRNELALNASWYRLLRGPYQQMGQPLSPQWSLESYDLRQLGGGTDSGRNTMRIQLSLSNQSQTDLPFPIVRLALYNRFGKRLLTRDLTVDEYLPPAMHSGEFMTRARRYDSEFAVAELAPGVASFELDVCLPAEHGMRCANDQPHT